MREADIFPYIRQKHSHEEEWRKVTHLVKYDKHMNVKSTHDFDIDCYVSSLGRLCRDGIICNLSYGDKYDISSMFTDTEQRQVRFKRHQIVLQTFLPEQREEFDTADHINNMERFDNSIYNLRWADKRTQCYNRHNIPGKRRMVLCIGDDEEIYSSCSEVERVFGLPRNSVGRVCRGELESICNLGQMEKGGQALRQNPCRKCPHSMELKGKRYPKYNSVCGECEDIVKHRKYLKSQRKYTKGERITSIEELLKQEWVMWYGMTKHISVFKNMQLRGVLNFLERGAFHYAIKKERQIPLKQIKRNPQEFDCEQCGNPIYKSRVRDDVKCCWCGYINNVGKFVGGRKHKKNDRVK